MFIQGSEIISLADVTTRYSVLGHPRHARARSLMGVKRDKSPAIVPARQEEVNYYDNQYPPFRQNLARGKKLPAGEIGKRRSRRTAAEAAFAQQDALLDALLNTPASRNEHTTAPKSILAHFCLCNQDGNLRDASLWPP